MTKVFIIESERGWGSHVEEEKYFSSREEAEQFCREYNSKHNPPGSTPDWYMYAHMEGQGYGMLRLEKDEQVAGVSEEEFCKRLSEEINRLLEEYLSQARKESHA